MLKLWQVPGQNKWQFQFKRLRRLSAISQQRTANILIRYYCTKLNGFKASTLEFISLGTKIDVLLDVLLDAGGPVMTVIDFDPMPDGC